MFTKAESGWPSQWYNNYKQLHIYWGIWLSTAKANMILSLISISLNLKLSTTGSSVFDRGQWGSVLLVFKIILNIKVVEWQRGTHINIDKQFHNYGKLMNRLLLNTRLNSSCTVGQNKKLRFVPYYSESYKSWKKVEKWWGFSSS